MMEHIERRLFENGQPVNSVVAVNNGDYCLAGELMVMSILQGGVAPSFIEPDSYGFIANKLTAENSPPSKYRRSIKGTTGLSHTF